MLVAVSPWQNFFKDSGAAERVVTDAATFDKVVAAIDTLPEKKVSRAECGVHARARACVRVHKHTRSLTRTLSRSLTRTLSLSHTRSLAHLRSHSRTRSLTRRHQVFTCLSLSLSL